MIPAIVVPAFNRSDALGRLLASLAAADIPGGTPLVIAIDRAGEERHRMGNAAVHQLARDFRWPHGPKEVIAHTEHLGLVGNIFFCGGLAAEYGAIVLLEDDLVVSQRFYDYAQQSLAFYADEPRLAGISLNALWFNGFTHQPFIPLPDDGDVFFLQLGTPQGQVYTSHQWSEFAGWVTAHGRRVTTDDNLHELFVAFPDDDWLAIKANYLVKTGKYYVYPRESLTTNFGIPGTHFNRPTTLFQVPLQHRRRAFRFLSLDEAIAVYDGFYEIDPERLERLAPHLRGVTLDVDLYASKSPHHLRAEHILTTRPCGRAIETYSKEMRPLEANVIAGLRGAGITLARREDANTGARATRRAQRDNDRYFDRQHAQPGRLGRLRRYLRRAR